MENGSHSRETELISYGKPVSQVEVSYAFYWAISGGCSCFFPYGFVQLRPYLSRAYILGRIASLFKQSSSEVTSC